MAAAPPRRRSCRGFVLELGVVLVEDGGDLWVEGGLVLDDGGEDGQEVGVHVRVREVARARSRRRRRPKKAPTCPVVREDRSKATPGDRVFSHIVLKLMSGGHIIDSNS